MHQKIQKVEISVSEKKLQELQTELNRVLEIVRSEERRVGKEC